MVRYKLMALLADKNPLSPAGFTEILARHQEFIAGGGGGGHWQTLLTDGGTEAGLILGIYVNASEHETAGAQAVLEHERLDGLDLRGVQLSFASLCGVSACKQDLSGADLTGSLATDADFSGASFQGAHLAGVDFSRSELAHCDFRGADLTGTDFEDADLSGADLRRATLTNASFKNARTDGARWPRRRSPGPRGRATQAAEGPQQDLFRAADRGDVAAAEVALGAGASLAAQDAAGLTALDRAVASGEVAMVRHLVERGAAVSRITLITADKSAYSSPWLLQFLQLTQLRQLKPQIQHKREADGLLLEAASEGDLVSVKNALAAGADVSVSDDQGNAALRWAVRHGHSAVVEALLEAGADVNQRSDTGWTALLEAVLAGDEDLASFLIAHGADVNARIFTNASILYLARDVVRFAADEQAGQRIVALLESHSAEYSAPAEDAD